MDMIKSYTPSFMATALGNKPQPEPIVTPPPKTVTIGVRG